MSNNNSPLIDKDNKTTLEPFDKIEQGTKRYIPNIPSVISDMKKNNIYINNDEIIPKSDNNKDNEKFIDENDLELIKTLNIEESKKLISNENNNQGSSLNTFQKYWYAFRYNETIATIINPFRNDGDLANTIYKIYSCITITLITIVILLSIILS